MSDSKIKQYDKSQGFDIADLMNPFPGLRPFGPEESHLFFGREGQSDEVLRKLSDNKFVGILGASGSGKSSLMYCGLIPTLHGGLMAKAGSHWKVVVMRPGGGPINNLAESLLSKDKEYLKLNEEDRLIKRTITSTVLRTSSLGLVEVIKQLNRDENENILLLVDQFEELFRFRKLAKSSKEDDESSAFVNLLLEAIHQYDQKIYIALTMRSDFIGECAQFPNLTQMINDSHYLIPQMTRDQKRLAIEGPVAVGGGKMSGRLVQQLLNDVGDRPDQLPILQHALMRTWQYWVDNRDDEQPLDLEHYNAIGTISEALSQHANEAFDSLSKREKQICSMMFKSLTEKGAENSGVRRPTKLSTLSSIAGVSEEEVTRVINKFREPGRSLLMPPYGVPLEPDTVVDISHESLMRIWVRLKQWLDEEAKSAEMYLKLSESAYRYQLGRAGLWKMPDLQLALNWQEENKPTLVWGQRYDPAYERTMVFLETSKKAYDSEQHNKEVLQKRALRKSRIVSLVLAAACLLSLFFIIFAFTKMVDADKQAQAAEENADRATKAQEDAKSQAKYARESAADARRAQGAAEKERAKAEEAKLAAQKSAKDALAAQARALKEAERARLAQVNADKQTLVATKALGQAEESAKLARSESSKAEKLRMLAIAQSMAIRSKQIRDPQQQGVIAKQAYQFYNEFADLELNGDIYSGLFYAAKSLQGDSINTLPGGHSGMVRSMIFSKNGRSMYSTGSDGSLYSRLLDSDYNIGEPELLLSEDYVSRVVKLSPDGKMLAVGGDSEEILIIDLDKPKKVKFEIKAHKGIVFDLVFMKDGSIASTGDDGSIIITKGNKDTRVLGKYSPRIKKLTLSRSGNLMIGTDETNKVRVWNLETGEEMQRLIKENIVISAVAINGTDDIAIFGDESGALTLWDLDKNEEIRTLTGHSAFISELTFSEDNKLLLSTSYDGTARLWQMDYLNELPVVIDDHESWVSSAAFHPSGDFFLTGSKDKTIRKWPIHFGSFADDICGELKYNMSDNLWTQYVGEDIKYNETCEGLDKSSE